MTRATTAAVAVVVATGLLTGASAWAGAGWTLAGLGGVGVGALAISRGRERRKIAPYALVLAVGGAMAMAALFGPAI